MYKLIIIVFFLAVFVVWLISPPYESVSMAFPVPNDSPPGSSLSVAVWNIHGGHTWYGESNIKNIQKEFANSLGKQDIVFLQEVPHNKLLDELANNNGFHKTGNRNAILSKYPIRNSGVIIINPETGRTASWADVEYINKTVIRIYSIHLSYKINEWSHMHEIRGAEIQRIIKHAHTFEGPIILAGDLNTIDPVARELDKRPVFQEAYRAGFKNAFYEQHCNTHMILGRIDWVLYKGMSPWQAGCGIYAGSDHRWMHETFFIK